MMRYRRHSHPRHPLAALLCCSIFLTLFGGSVSSYVKVAAQKSYQKGDELMVRVNSLTSVRNQVPYSYYSLPYCRPEKFGRTANSLEQVLFGDHSEISPFAFKMLEAERCRIVCRMKLDAQSAKDFKEKIEDNYRVQMMLDDRPLVSARMQSEKSTPIYRPGFLVGLTGNYVGEKERRAVIYNHLSFIVKYNTDLYHNSTNIVGFEVRPLSVRHKYKGTLNKSTPLTTCDLDKESSSLRFSSVLEVKDDQEIIFTYNVDFQESVIKWASRRDAYVIRRKFHWFNILSSLAVALMLSGKVALIVSRTFRNISMDNNELEPRDETQEETGWKAVRGDVFRPPSNASLFCIFTGTGVQVFGTALGALILAILDFLPHSNRNGLPTTMLLLWAFMGLFAGYTCIRLHNMFKGTAEWKVIAFSTAVTFPTAIFVMFFALNALLGREKSSAALPFVTLVNLFMFNYAISVPAVILGTYIGFKMPAIANPVAPRNIPRQIPVHVWYKKPVVWFVLGGMIPYGVIERELFLILTSLCMHQYYDSYSSLFLAFILLIITCAVTTIIICYVQLCKENYLWWWSSFLTAGSSTIYFLLFATYYLLVRLQLTKTVPLMLCFGYVLIAASAFFLMTGSIGFLAFFWFTRLIYSSVKID